MGRRREVRAEDPTLFATYNPHVQFLEPEGRLEEGSEEYFRGPSWTISPFFSAIGLRAIHRIRKELHEKDNLST